MMPRWLSETYADMLSARTIPDFGNTRDNPDNWVLYSRAQPYCDGYGTGMQFLDAVDRRFPGFIHKLSEYIVTMPGVWPGSEAVFQTLTGVGLSQIYSDYLTDYQLTLKYPVSMCAFPNDTPGGTGGP
jgi:hypothetical protein